MYESYEIERSILDRFSIAAIQASNHKTPGAYHVALAIAITRTVTVFDHFYHFQNHHPRRRNDFVLLAASSHGIFKGSFNYGSIESETRSTAIPNQIE